MMIKLFFLAAASAMFMVYNVFQTQVTYRTPSSAVPLAVPNVYSYQDITTVFENAMAKDHANKLAIDSLTTEIARNQVILEETRKDSRRMMEMASPYNPISRQISELQRNLHMTRLVRQNNLDKAYWDILSIYTQIQMPPKDGRPGLNEEQHRQARWMMSHILQVKAEMNCAIPALCVNPALYANPEQEVNPMLNMNPTLQDGYMSGYDPQGIYSPAPVEPYTGVTTPHVERLEAETAPLPMTLPMGTVEPLPEEETIAQ